MEIQEFMFRLLAATLAGIVIGLERQWHHKAAGLRTITLVSTGAALYVLLSIQITQVQGDVTRIIGQVVTGIGFLCAGIIYKEGINIHGLTTSATVWITSAIGCIAAAGLYLETIVSTLAVLTINLVLVPLEKWLSKQSKE